MNERLQQFAESFVESTREYVFIRPEDNLLILRPNKVHYLNKTATHLLGALYGQEQVDVGALVDQMAARYEVPGEQIEGDLDRLLESLNLILNDRTGCAPAVRMMPFGTHHHKFPVLSEIALTYKCQARCFFCYASAPDRGPKVDEMMTAEVQTVLDKIVGEAKVPTVSFTGGEPTLRNDLPELIAYAKELGLRANLITNGIRSGNEAFAYSLAEAGLDSAQVSLEAGNAEAHDAVVGLKGAFARTVKGVQNLKKAGIHTHTNTTINSRNKGELLELVDYLAEIGQEYLSMNMVIRTGDAVGTLDIQYQEIGDIVLALKERAESHGMRFVWYSPVPHCLFNTIAHGLGSQGCAAADGLLSIGPDGRVLPCSSFEEGFGNLLTEDFDAIWHRRSAKYWRNKEFLPPGCRSCDQAELCCGACPLYWDEQGGFDEILPYMEKTNGVQDRVWQMKRKYFGRLEGVGVKTL